MFNFPPKTQLAQLPTPIIRLERLSSEINSDIRVKDDCLTGSELSGNKVRKLEYLFADAASQGCDTVITCGAVTSNHARATAIAARRVGLDVHLVLAGDVPPVVTGNLQLDLLVGAHVTYITRQQYSNEIEAILEETAGKLRMAGKNPYIIPTGGSNSVGLIGYIEAVQEMKFQCENDNWFPDYVVCAVGSCGTYSGLFLGNAIYSLASHIMGVLVCGTIGQFQDKIIHDIQETCRNCQVDLPDFGKIILHDGYIGDGYAKTNPAQLNLIRRLAGQEGIILDPVYTGKAFYGMLEEINKGQIPAQSKVLFIHTGGIFGLPSFSGEFMKEWPATDYWPGT